jgi:ABC-type molybdate transport system substrate-binding protein
MTGVTGLRALLTICLAATGILPATHGMAGVVEVFHADSLAGPMRELKKAFEEKNKDVTINLTSGASKQLAERILKGTAATSLPHPPRPRSMKT